MKSFVLLTALLVSGCVQSHYTQTVSVRTDATGKVLERVETETVQQGAKVSPSRLSTFTTYNLRVRGSKRNLVSRLGLEPRALALKGRCSTD
jgi:PBP1b-binding outer membrane lipoprotein LpoB